MHPTKQSTAQNDMNEEDWMEVAVFWDVASCSLVDIDGRFRGAYCLHRHGRHMPDYTAQHLRRQRNSYLPPWEPEILTRRLFSFPCYIRLLEVNFALYSRNQKYFPMKIDFLLIRVSFPTVFTVFCKKHGFVIYFLVSFQITTVFNANHMWPAGQIIAIFANWNYPETAVPCRRHGPAST
jgi:hypothetical protein